MKTKPLTFLLALTFLFLLSGSVFSDDNNETIKGWKLAAEQGYVEAQFNLGMMYADGQGVAEDYAEAIKWLKLAAEQKFEAAQFKLELMHLNENILN